MASELNYFTCTLGHAAALKKQACAKNSEISYVNVLQMLEYQSSANPESLALGMAECPTQGSPPARSSVPLTFSELCKMAAGASMVLSRYVKARSMSKDDAAEAVIALLSPSNIEFVLIWLGLMRLGYTVLFIAPGLGEEAMLHLCETLDVQTFFVHSDLCHTIPNAGFGPRIIQIPPDLHATEKMPPPPQSNDCYIASTAYICHSSGTSSGLPKPIYQSHSGVVGCLYPFARSENGQSSPATFTVTPLYHGGTPDCLRAWSSGAMCWLFPQGSIPITGSNVIKSVQAARSVGVEVGYFSSVPFVLQMLLDEDHEAGIHLLQTFDLVGFGGAALPHASGDRLVKAGVRLLSRMGSAECGFLMSSHRNYAEDKEWNYLRPINDNCLLSFEPRDQGLSELVVREKWPFKTKTNCDGGKSYATSDLFEPHPHISNAWQYHGRADAQIVLANGKKFDPAPLEADIMAAASRLGLRDVLIFGTNMSHAGALLFSSSDNDVTDRVWHTIKDMNKRSQSHARISKSMLIVVPADKADDPPLPKSSKGTVMRAKAEERYGQFINSAHSTPSNETPVPDDQLQDAVMACFVDTLGREVDAERDLYQQGIDSIACAQIRGSLQSQCLVEGSLPLNVIYDKRTISGLADYMMGLRHGFVNGDVTEQKNAELKSMRELVDQYGTFHFTKETGQRMQGDGDGSAIVLTGATGFLGAHILHLLRQDPSITKIFSLVRTTGSQSAHQRVSQALTRYGRPGLDDSGSSMTPVLCLPCNLSQTDLGLSKQDMQSILKEVSKIIHGAWTVNFNLGLHSFEDQMLATQNLINTAEVANAKFFFLSSAAAVSASQATSIPEALSTEPSDASPLGYSRSKWVTEQICNAANKVKGSSFASVIRIGQLCANEGGVWNASEAYPLMLSTARLTGCLPIIDDNLDWVPVEIAAQAVLDIIEHESQSTTTAFYHVVNPHKGPIWPMLLQQLVDKSGCNWLHVVSSDDWIEKLEIALKTDGHRHHPSQALVSLWKTRYCRSTGLGADDTGSKQSDDLSFEVSQSQTVSSTMRDIGPLDLKRVDKIWAWLDRTIA